MLANRHPLISTLVAVAITGMAPMSLAPAGTIRYVDDDAPAGGDGVTWEAAYRFLTDALNNAADPLNGVALIRVAQGIYFPDESASNPSGSNDRLDTFLLPRGVLVAGGYAGLGAKDLNARDPAVFVTVLSGDIDHDGITEDNENSYHVLKASVPGPGSTGVVLDGFTITGGHANAPSGPNADGAGLQLSAGDLFVYNCTFVDNVCTDEGGAVVVTSANFANSIEFHECVFSQNSATQGGALWGARNVQALLSDCTFTENSAAAGGGAVLAFNSTFIRCEFSNNVATAIVSGSITVGGAVFAGNAVFVSCTFDGNAADRGGAAYLTGSSNVDACMFANNSAEDGGAIYCDTSVDIRNSAFHSNTSDVSGGAIHLQGGSFNPLLNCLFEGNSAGTFGGAIRLSNFASADVIACLFRQNSAGAGGAVRLDGGSPTFTNCLFFGNVADLGGAMMNFEGMPSLTNSTVGHNIATDSGGGLYSARGAPVVTNSILWGNSDIGGTDESAQIDGIASSSVVNYSDVQGGWSGLGGIGNINSDPRFVDADGADDIPGTEDDDFRLQPGSPCIDAGDNTAVPIEITTDLDGNPRFVNDPGPPDTGNGTPPIVDMGAYEFQRAGPCHSDINGDGSVNVLDLVALLLCFGDPATPPCDTGQDVNGDGDVNVLDLIDLLLAFGTACP